MIAFKTKFVVSLHFCIVYMVVLHIRFYPSFGAMADTPTRDEKVRRLAELLHENLVEGQMDRIRQSGALTPTNGLRHRRTRECLKFVHGLDGGRWFTHGMVRDAVVLLMKAHPLELPSIPGYSEKTWVNQTVDVLLNLLQRSKKNSKAVSGPGASTDDAMDNAETQILDENEEGLHKFHVSLLFELYVSA